MSRKLTLICALIGLAAFLAAPAYAEVQNIKVSGDIEALAVYRNNYDLEGKREGAAGGTTGIGNSEDQNSFLMSVIRLQVDADLTDNVAACVRLANLREWDATATANDENEISLDLANITLKEMLYSPLTLIIGRQELNYGSGLIVGNGLYQDPNAVRYNDLSPLHGYDAVRAVLDYDPWTLDLLMAKMSEVDDTAGLDARDGDIDLYGANLGYLFGSYDAEMEGYIFYKRDEQYGLIAHSPDDGGSGTATFDDNHVYTGGLRASLAPYENLSVNAEIAGQWGTIHNSAARKTDGLSVERDRSALAANVGGKYAFADVRFAPTVGVEYLYTSGEEVDETAGNIGEEADTGDFDAWDPMYRGKVMGGIRDYLEYLYVTGDPADTSGLTNQQTLKVTGSMDLGELVDGLSLNLAYLHYWFDEAPSYTLQDDDIGDEVNLSITYDYTEDVQFALDSTVFVPGDYYDVETARTSRVYTVGGMTNADTAVNANREANDVAVSVVGSCKVTF